MDSRSVPASIYRAFCESLVVRVNADLDDRELGYARGRGPDQTLLPTSVLYVRASSTLLYLLDRASPETVAAAFGDAISRLRRRAGDDPERWQWGRLHSVRFTHAFGQGSRTLDRALGLSPHPVPVGGDSDTVAQAGVDPWDRPQTTAYNVSYRQVFDVGDWDHGSVVLPGGQSGHPASRHYTDQLPRWNRGEYVPLLFSDAAIAANAEGSIRLRPPG
jgi:penicillin amidase